MFTKRALYTGFLGLIVVMVILVALFVRSQTQSTELISGGEVGIGGGPPATQPPVVAQNNILTSLEEQGNFTIFIESLRLAGMLDRLRGPEKFTIFAPTDEAFAKVGTNTLYPMFSDRNALRTVIEAHIVQGEVYSRDFESSTDLRSLEGENLTLTNNSVNGINISKKDITSSNGVVHAIDDIILPPNYLLNTREEI